MRRIGVHQGRAPVLDVVRDARWGRVEETIGEDPYLVATTATAYIRGLESAGIVAPLKHFAGYSASKAGRNPTPVSIGPRELPDVLITPFALSAHDDDVPTFMHYYTALHRQPTSAHRPRLTSLLAPPC